MLPPRSFFLFCIVLLCSACNSGGNTNLGGSTAPPTPTYISFDAPGAETLSATGSKCGTVPADINSSSIIVGTSYASDSSTQGFSRSPEGEFTTIVAPVTGETAVSSINDSGTILGNVSPSLAVGSQPFIPQAFTLTNGQYSFHVAAGVAPYYPLGQLSTASINGSNQFVGSIYVLAPVNGVTEPISQSFYSSSDGLLHIFCCSGGLLAPPVLSQASRIDDAGNVVGSYAGHGFLYNLNNQSFVSLDGPVPAGSTASPSTAAIDINSNGIIVGTYTDALSHSFLRTPDGAFTIFDPPLLAFKGSRPVRINSSGQIAGNFTDSGSISHGYIRQPDGTFTIIDEPDSVAASTYGTVVTGMNEAGTIIGYYYDYRSVCHGFVRK